MRVHVVAALVISLVSFAMSLAALACVLAELKGC
jgi:hypothetical protein